MYYYTCVKYNSDDITIEHASQFFGPFVTTQNRLNHIKTLDCDNDILHITLLSLSAVPLSDVVLDGYGTIDDCTGIDIEEFKKQVNINNHNSP